LTFLSRRCLENGKNDTISGYHVEALTGSAKQIPPRKTKEGLGNKISQAICSGPNLLI